MKTKVSELIGSALGYAVALAEGAAGGFHDTVAAYWVKLDGKDRALSGGWAQSYQPQTNWAQGGPIIERERIDLQWMEGQQRWRAVPGVPGLVVYAETPLLAAMRCYVATKLGDEVEIPGELLK